MPLIDWGFFVAQTPDSKDLVDYIVDLDLQQLVRSSTHARGMILDIVFTNMTDFKPYYNYVGFFDPMGVLLGFNAISWDQRHDSHSRPCERLQTGSFAEVASSFSTSLFSVTVEHTGPNYVEHWLN